MPYPNAELFSNPLPSVHSSRIYVKKHTKCTSLVRTRSADKSLALLASRCILFDSENISFDASLVIYINSTNIPPIMIINRAYETQNLLSL